MQYDQLIQKRISLGVMWRFELLSEDERKSVISLHNEMRYDDLHDFLISKRVMPEPICSSCNRADVIGAFVVHAITNELI